MIVFNIRIIIVSLYCHNTRITSCFFLLTNLLNVWYHESFHIASDIFVVESFVMVQPGIQSYPIVMSPGSFHTQLKDMVSMETEVSSLVSFHVTPHSLSWF